MRLPEYFQGFWLQAASKFPAILHQPELNRQLTGLTSCLEFCIPIKAVQSSEHWSWETFHIQFTSASSQSMPCRYQAESYSAAGRKRFKPVVTNDGGQDGCRTASLSNFLKRMYKSTHIKSAPTTQVVAVWTIECRVIVVFLRQLTRVNACDESPGVEWLPEKQEDWQGDHLEGSLPFPQRVDLHSLRNKAIWRIRQHEQYEARGTACEGKVYSLVLRQKATRNLCGREGCSLPRSVICQSLKSRQPERSLKQQISVICQGL